MGGQVQILTILITLSSTFGSGNVIEKLTQHQSQLLSKFKHCVIRKVFLENSIQASEETLLFFNYYKNNAVFILESIPVNPYSFNPNSTQAIASQRNIRFLTCYAIFYFQDQLIKAIVGQDDLSPELILAEYFRKSSIRLRKENPQSIVFITFEASPPLEHYRYLEYIDTTSSFYVLSFVYAKLVCVTCGSRILHEPELFSDSTWRQIHIDFGNQIVVSNLINRPWDTNKITDFYACGVFPRRLTEGGYPGAQNCFYRVVKQLLNTTNTGTSQLFGVATFLLMTRENVKTVLLKHDDSKTDVLPYSMTIVFYRIGTLTSPYGQDIRSLTKPLDEATWSFLIASIFSLCLYFRIVFKLTKKRSILETHVISILLEQSQHIVTQCNNFGMQTSVLLVSWMLLAFLVGNAYKGVLFSLLTSLSIPMVPDTLQEAVQSHYSLVTTESILVTQERKQVRTSAAKLYIQSIVEEVESGKLNISHIDWYKKLNTTMVFMNPADASDLFVSQVTRIELRSETKNFSIPEKVIIINPEKDVRLFEELNTIFTRNVLVMGETLGLFSTRYHWVIRRNAFLRLILPVLSGLEESGIYRKWDYYSEVLHSRMHLHYARRVLNKHFNSSKSQFSLKDNIIAYLLFKPHTAESSPHPVPITLEFFAVFALLFGYCVAICFVVFVFEKCKNLQISRMVGVTCRNIISLYYAGRNRFMIAWLSRRYGFELCYIP